MVRQERMLEAIAYSRKHLAPWAGQYQAELQRALTALAFKAGTTCAPYAALFADSAWHACSDLFCKDLYRLHSMPPESQLKVHLQVSTPSCAERFAQLRFDVLAYVTHPLTLCGRNRRSNC